MLKLDYIEFWATKHCNLNCKGCSSCSPIQEEWYLDADNLYNDLKRLNDVGILIDYINILGGEPLLHPAIIEIFNTVLKVYPNTHLGIITNGLLLLRQDDIFWKFCSYNRIKINVTCFPIMPKEMVSDIVDRFVEFKIPYHLTNKIRFNKILKLNNTDSFDSIQSSCGCNNAFNLYDGFVSRCTVPMVTSKLNDYFHVNFITEGRLNIYTANGDEIIQFLNTPNRACLNCSANLVKVKWEKASESPELEDWILL